MNGERNLRSGVTLIEIMVVIGIFAIIAGIAAPTLSRYLPNQRLMAASREIFANIQSAKIQAVKARCNAVIVFSPAAYTPGGGVGSFQVYLDKNGDFVYTPSGADPDVLVVPPVTMPANVSLYQALFIDNGAGNTQTMAFNSHGMGARSNPGGQYLYGYVRLRNNQNRYIMVSVVPTGSIDIQQSSDGVNWN
jgi:prepilin-type N-terminal cleavage/methylation domain-containing protein